MKTLEYAIKGLRAPFYRRKHKNDPFFTCPICRYHGPFMAKNQRLHAKCPRCGELERARLQFLVMRDYFAQHDVSSKSLLHVAPENAFRKWFRKEFGQYTSCDLFRKDVDHRFDLQNIPLADASFDVVFASHVLMYPEDDVKAIAEIRRILKPGGLAILPVPFVHEKTVEFGAPDPSTQMRREAGLDYYQRFEQYFSRVEIFDARNYPAEHQLLTNNGAKAASMPYFVKDGWSSDVVPFCYV
ncbi:class I SAM-dependent methyltransferase [Permianibacter aggregans]|uniref:Methyltransferase family protein n=1 Tax=Permianibacter aggregans TaxID=1510150 RepID=A0A4R6UQ41_9GAMM|nr:class I SAM-dependent methyltransferase [Permianibacter aggregans]TDQ47613.1 methyltransferase family protein [Permianibacter aggregans]